MLDDSLKGAKRILVYGVTGSGKTTMARQLSEVTGLPWHAVDDLTWEPGWVEVPFEEQKRRIQDIVDQEEWILDGAYAKWIEIPLARVQLVVALDYSRGFSFRRLLGRSVMRALDGAPICNGNRETFRAMFSRDSILLWHMKSYKSKHRRIAAWEADPNGPRVIRFTKPYEANAWLTRMRLRTLA